MNNKEKILSELFENSEKEFHIRLLARMTHLNPNTISSITDKLEQEGLVKKQLDNERKIKIIRPNIESGLFKLEKKIYNLKKISNSGLIEYLNKKLGYPALFLFGSYAKGENHSDSDIDIFVVVDKKETIDLSVFEKKLKAEIQIFLHTKKEFKKLEVSNPELINNVLNGIKLAGYLEVI